jgi:thioredoxin reductase (NADPH)
MVVRIGVAATIMVPPVRDAPVLLVVDDDPRTRGVVGGELRKRYGSDYQVVCADSADDPPRLLARFRDDRRLVSIVLASQRMSQGTGTELLARVREFHRTAKRLLLIDWGYGPSATEGDSWSPVPIS